MKMPLKILLADDDKDDRLFFKLALDTLSTPTDLEVVVDGEKLMSYLAENSKKLPDVLFLDLNMPRKNGFECLTEIRLNKIFKNLPVIIFSTSYEQEVVNQLFINGARNFMRKPADFFHLKKIIEKTVHHILKKEATKPLKENFVLKL